MKNKLNIAIFIICALVAGALVYQIITLDLLPNQLLVIVICFVIILLLLCFALSLKWKAFGNILMCLLVAMSGFGNFYLHKTNNLLGSISELSEEKVKFSIVALKEFEHEPSSLGVISVGNLDFQSKALEKIGNEYEVKDYADYESFPKALYDGEVDSLLVSDSSIDLIEENKPSFMKDIKVIDSFVITSEKKTIDSNVDILNEPFNIYISGKDAASIDSLSRSDVNIILSINPKTHQILMTGVPRDFFIPQTCQNNQKDKLTHTGTYGIACTVDSMANYMNIPIDYYVEVNFESLVDVVDALGGVTVDSPYDFVSLHGKYHFTKGPNEMDGDEALGFVRERYSFQDGDRERSRNQMRVLTAIIDKAMSPSIIGSYPKLMDTLSSSFKTNLTKKEMTSFIKSQLLNMSPWDIQQIQVNGSGSMTVSPALGFEVYVMVPNEETVQGAQKLIEKLLANEVVTEEDIQKQNDLVAGK